MERLVKPEANEVEIMFQKCRTTFKLTNLMHTMTVAVSLTTTNPSIFSINKPLSVIPPLSSASYTLHLTPPGQPPLSDPPDVITVRTSMLPTGKAPADHLRRLFSRPGPHVFRDAVIPITLVGPHAVELLISEPLQSRDLFTKAITACSKPHLTNLLKPAVESGEVDTVAALIAAGGDPKGQSLIPLAVKAGKLELVKLLVASGCRINDSVEAGAVLLEAAAVDRIDVVEFLFEIFGEELDVNSANSKGVTPVHVAAMEGHVRVIELLVSKGGDPEAVDSGGWTPLHFAAWRGHPKAVECLLERADTKRVRDKEGRTPFSVAAECGHAQLLGILRWSDGLYRAARADDVHGLKRCIAEQKHCLSPQLRHTTLHLLQNFQPQTEL